MPLTFEDGEADLPVQQRTADAGTDVIDLTAMREELEAGRRQRKGGV